MKLTRRAKQRVNLILATRKAEVAKPKLNYESLAAALIPFD